MLEGIGLIEKKLKNRIQWKYEFKACLSLAFTWKIRNINHYSMHNTPQIVWLIRGLDVSRPGEIDESVSSLQVHKPLVLSFCFFPLRCRIWFHKKFSTTGRSWKSFHGGAQTRWSNKVVSCSTAIQHCFVWPLVVLMHWYYCREMQERLRDLSGDNNNQK